MLSVIIDLVKSRLPSADQIHRTAVGDEGIGGSPPEMTIGAYFRVVLLPVLFGTWAGWGEALAFERRRDLAAGMGWGWAVESLYVQPLVVRLLWAIAWSALFVLALHGVWIRWVAKRTGSEDVDRATWLAWDYRNQLYMILVLALSTALTWFLGGILGPFLAPFPVLASIVYYLCIKLTWIPYAHTIHKTLVEGKL